MYYKLFVFYNYSANVLNFQLNKSLGIFFVEGEQVLIVIIIHLLRFFIKTLFCCEKSFCLRRVDNEKFYGPNVTFTFLLLLF